VIERSQNAHRTLRKALVDAVRDRTRPAHAPPVPDVGDPAKLVATRVAPMVRGLLSRKVHQAACERLVRSIEFVLPATVEAVLHGAAWHSSAWNIANLYLAWYGAELLGPEAYNALGLACGHRCYVTASGSTWPPADNGHVNILLPLASSTHTRICPSKPLGAGRLDLWPPPRIR